MKVLLLFSIFVALNLNSSISEANEYFASCAVKTFYEFITEFKLQVESLSVGEDKGQSDIHKPRSCGGGTYNDRIVTVEREGAPGYVIRFNKDLPKEKIEEMEQFIEQLRKGVNS